MDILKLNQRAVDEIHPYVEQLVSSLAKVKSLPGDFDGLIKVKSWLKKLNDLRAYDEIEEGDVRQFLFDVETSYNGFLNNLGPKSH
jgi:ESCRT-I complex subunit VPS28